jgi:hypothetical protein
MLSVGMGCGRSGMGCVLSVPRVVHDGEPGQGLGFHLLAAPSMVDRELMTEV